MTAPKHIQEKAAQLNKALARVAKLSQEIEDWVGSKTDDDYAQQFVYEARLDMPYEFNLDEVLDMLNEVAEGNMETTCEW